MQDTGYRQDLRRKISEALQGSIGRCPCCQVCDVQVNAVMAVLDGEPGREPPIDLARIARDLQATLRANRANGLTDENALDVTALLVAEEAGELIGAYRRWSGHARRSGTLGELAAEVADLLIGAAIFAEVAGIDLNEAVTAKLARIYSRGWKEPASA